MSPSPLPTPANGPSGNVYHNVFLTSPRVPSGQSHVQFTLSQEYFAIFGTPSTHQDGNVVVHTSSYLPATLGPNGSFFTLSTVGGSASEPVWDQKAAQGKVTAASGGFTIAADHSFEYPNSIYVGCGAQTNPPDANTVVPIQTYIAEPGLQSQFFPRPKYYVTTGNYQPGTIVDLTTLGDVLQVDFTTSAVPEASFNLNSHGVFEADKSVGNNGVSWCFGSISDA
ncbi:hypothetical protein B0H67DRAFT_548169 [Lasiosphaeris hirsuta]|uniref:Uncharacterized protein n=1 Tax=Lasiosphaeris hirsuta TaxID=260670 RepID=A0AA40B9Z4_9PEZI|nr:hypothetical protein B0H67DRAFT_548169 [Lasiosphaeris hirsuta]